MTGTSRITVVLALLLTLGAAPLSAQDGTDAAPTDGKASAQERFDALVAAYTKKMQEFQEGFAGLETDEERRKHFEENQPKPEATAEAMLALAKESPDEIGFTVVEWVLSNRVSGDPKSAALALLSEHHLDDPRAANLLWGFSYELESSIGKFLENAIERSEDENLLGVAHYVLAKHLQGQVEFARYYAGSNEEEKKAMAQFFGEETLESLGDLDPATVEARCEGLFTKVVEKYADVPTRRGGKLGDTASRDLFELRNLSIGKTAPEIEGEDLFGTAFKLSDYRGKVIFLDFWGDW